MWKRTSTTVVRMLLIVILTASIPLSTHAEPLQPFPWEDAIKSEELHNVLQQSLSIQELDEEIARISSRSDKAAKAQAELQSELETEQKQLTERQERAGKALRSYYMGDKDILLKAILASKSLTDMFQLLDYYMYILENDQRVLLAYRDNVRNIKRLKGEQEKLQQELSQVMVQLQAQRARLVKLETELDSDVANSSDPAKMQRLIQEFTSYWQTVGLFEVKHYFQAIAQAMNKLPDYVMSNGNLQSNGFSYTLVIKDSELNEFLRNQDSMFNDFSFKFEQDRIAAIGEREGIKVYVEGQYTIEYEPEHAIRFHIDKLQFNGLSLSEETRNDLAAQFDLSFYPQQLVKFIEASSVQLEPGLLTVQLKIKL